MVRKRTTATITMLRIRRTRLPSSTPFWVGYETSLTVSAGASFSFSSAAPGQGFSPKQRRLSWEARSFLLAPSLQDPRPNPFTGAVGDGAWSSSSSSISFRPRLYDTTILRRTLEQNARCESLSYYYYYWTDRPRAATSFIRRQHVAELPLPGRDDFLHPRPSLRYYSSSRRILDAESSSPESSPTMSDKERKKMLKAQAKAATEAAAASSDDKGPSLAEKLAAKKAATAATAGDDPPKDQGAPTAEGRGGGGEPEDAAAAQKRAMQEKLAAKKADAAPSSPEEAPAAAADASAAPTDATPSSSSLSSPPVAESSGPRQYSDPQITADAARHKAGLSDPTRPPWQNPLHHNNPDMQKIFREDFDSEEEFLKAVVPAPPFADTNGPASPEYLQALADEMLHLTMLEMNELVNKIADHYGFHEGLLTPPDDAMTGAADGPGLDEEAGAAPAAAAAVKTVFDIKLVSFDEKAKIKIIKEVRAIAGLGLKEAKELVESAPKVIQKDIKKEQADEIKAKLEEAGATVEIV